MEIEYKFKEDDKVIVSRLGTYEDGKEAIFNAIIRGPSTDLGPYGHNWIVEWIDIPRDWYFSCSTKLLKVV